MPNPQQPEQRRSEYGGTVEHNPDKQRGTRGGHEHGTDKGSKGGGRGHAKGDPRPPEQRPPYPA